MVSPLPRNYAAAPIKSANIKSMVLMVAMLVSSATVWGVDFVKDGFEYTINSDRNSVSVGIADKNATGNFAIPSSVTQGGTTYTVTAITEKGFAASNISSVTIPQTVTKIDSLAFQGSKNLKSILIPKSVKEIGKGAFEWCTEATSITFEEGSAITYIAPQIFNACRKVRILEIPEGVKGIDTWAFQGMESLSLINLPSTLVKIGHGAIANCPKLRFINIRSANPLGIDVDVFYTYTNRDFQFNTCAIYVPEDLITFYRSNFVWSRFKNAFTTDFKILKSGEFTYATISEDEVAAVDCVNDIRSVDFPDKVSLNGKEYKITNIGGSLFQDNLNLVSVTLPSCLREIGSGAFFECWNLKGLNLPDGLETIGDYAFKGSGITKILMPNSVTSVGRSCFSVSLKELRLSKKLTEIPEEMADWAMIQSIKIPEGVTTIGRRAFYHCGLLKEVILPSTLVSLGEDVFDQSNTLTSITCKAVTPPVCSGNLMFVSEVYQKATLMIPAGSFEAYSTTAPWSSFSNIVEVEFGDENLIESVGLRFYVIDDNNVKVIGLTGQVSSISIPTGVRHDGIFVPVTEIGENAFAGSRLVSVDIPNSVTKIGNGAFGGITMTSVKIHAAEPPVCPEDAFSASTYSDATLYVGAHCKQVYASAPGWKNFGNIEEEAVAGDSFTVGDLRYTIIEDDFVEVGINGSAASNMSLTEIVVPEEVSVGGVTYSVIRIADRGFMKLGCPVKDGSGTHSADCSGTVTVTLPETIDEIGREAFYGAHIREVNLPPYLSIMGESCFAQSTLGGRVEIPETCSEIPANAFSGSRISEVFLPASLISIGYDAFASTGYLAKVEAEDLESFLNLSYESEKSNPLCDGTLAGGTILYYAEEPVTEIDFEDFSMTSLGDYALYGCKSIGKLTFPGNFTEIGRMAVKGCSNIETVVCKNVNVVKGPGESEGFDSNVYENATLFVPSGCGSAYRQQAVWKPFRNVVESEAGIGGIEADNGVITVCGREILNPSGQLLRIHSITGTLVYEGKENLITLIPGFYIAETGDSIRKICIN